MSLIDLTEYNRSLLVEDINVEAVTHGLSLGAAEDIRSSKNTPASQTPSMKSRTTKVSVFYRLIKGERYCGFESG